MCYVPSALFSRHVADEVKMKHLLPLTVILITIYATASFAKNSCTCYPIVDSKTYQGEARKKHFVGYSINWSCDYRCEISTNTNKDTEVVKAFYREYYFRSNEMGTEGVCEGMVYEPQFVMQLGREVYMFHGKTFGFIPSQSISKDLKAWATKNNCD